MTTNRPTMEETAQQVRQCIIETMPETAYASGLTNVNPDCSNWVQVKLDEIYTRGLDIPDHLGLTPLTAWLTSKGITGTTYQIRNLRKRLLLDRMRIESHRLAGK